MALITTRLRSAPGYPAMAARCALLAPGRRAPPARRALVPNGHPCCPPPHQRPTTASPTRAARAIRIARTSPSHLVLAGRDAPAPMARSKQHTRIHNAHTPLIVKLSSNNHPPKLDVATLRLHGFTGSLPSPRAASPAPRAPPLPSRFASPPFAMIRIVRPPRPRDVHAFPGRLLLCCTAPACPTPPSPSSTRLTRITPRIAAARSHARSQLRSPTRSPLH